MALYNNIREFREAQNLSQSSLAYAVQTTPETICRIECGSRNPSVELAMRIAQYFDVSFETIFQLDDAESRLGRTG